MENLSLKEKAILAAIGVVLLYALAVGVWFMHSADAWKKAQKQYVNAVKTYKNETKLISEKELWAAAYEEEKALMPMFEEGKNTDTTWLQKMDELAAKHYIQIANRQGGKEVEAGDVLELPIEVKNWEGAWENLVKFAWEIENTSDGMFDIRAISFKPSAKKGFLKGNFTLTCAYMRE